MSDASSLAPQEVAVPTTRERIEFLARKTVNVGALLGFAAMNFIGLGFVFAGAYESNQIDTFSYNYDKQVDEADKLMEIGAGILIADTVVVSAVIIGGEIVDAAMEQPEHTAQTAQPLEPISEFPQSTQHITQF